MLGRGRDIGVLGGCLGWLSAMAEAGRGREEEVVILRGGRWDYRYGAGLGLRVGERDYIERGGEE